MKKQVESGQYFRALVPLLDGQYFLKIDPYRIYLEVARQLIDNQPTCYS